MNKSDSKTKVVALAGVLLAGSIMVASCSGASQKASVDSNGAATTVVKQAGQSNSGSGALVDPTTLLSNADVQAALGAPVKEVKVTDGQKPIGQKIVMYKTTVPLKFMTLSVIQDAGMTDEARSENRSAKSEFTVTRSTLPKTQAMSGIGDDAFWDGSKGYQTGLHVMKGNVYFTVSVCLGVVDDASRLKLDKQLAAKALTRIP